MFVKSIFHKGFLDVFFFLQRAGLFLRLVPPGGGGGVGGWAPRDTPLPRGGG